MFTIVIIALVPTILMLTAVLISAIVSGYSIEETVALVGMTIITAFFGVLSSCVGILDLLRINIISTSFRVTSITFLVLTIIAVIVSYISASLKLSN